MKNIKIVILIIYTLIHYSCSRESIIIDSDRNEIYKGKIWLEKFILSNEINPIFKDIKYHWENAKVFTFINGYKAITIPILNTNQNPLYRGRRVLYLYPWKNGKGFYSTVFEFLPEVNHLNVNKGNINLERYTGIISTWDLIKGFSRGAYFINGIPQQNILLEYFEQPVETLKVKQAETNIALTSLPPVTVVGFIPAPNFGFFWVTLMNYLGYSTSYLWNGGTGGNPCEYTGCSFSENPVDYFDPVTINQISQELIDKQWLDQSVKDSTNNPCISEVLNTLSEISEKLPKLIRGFFNSDANFSMTLKMTDLGASKGAQVRPNILTSNFDVEINSYFNNATDLSLVTTIIHEAFHCQLMSWYREAVVNNDIARQQQLASQYGYLFSKEIIDLNNDFISIINGGNSTHHNDIVLRYKNLIANALFEFAQAKGINVNLDYCRDLALAGTFDSKAFSDLTINEKNRIIDRVNAEKDPYGEKNINSQNETTKGRPCQ